ncbi:hypothetical protein B0T10DRAFT_550777 [Thelonectria olida]|uniref:Protein kinase domain-containing protein n=1 Tax=Thelonectria olida TaxID=1576542 RepID=A0A9P8VZL2_9HYPO|nr:hypothetical protein B0T10DRAFT_550777 [Thelonectria olida]
MDLSTGFAVIAFADQCTKYGTKLVKRCQAYRHAREETLDLLITIEHNWQKTHAQIQVLREVSESLPESYQNYFSTQALILSRLEGKLKTATLTLDELLRSQRKSDDHSKLALVDRIKASTKMGARSKTRYAFHQSSLQSIVDDLEKWQARFDPSWMLILRMKGRPVEKVLAGSSGRATSHSIIATAKEVREAIQPKIEDAPQESSWLDATKFDVSSPVASLPPLSMVQLKATGDRVLVDKVHCLPMADPARLTKDLCKLAHILTKVDPDSFGMLQCLGIIKGEEAVEIEPGESKQIPAFSFAFKVPSDWESPRSLRSILLEASPYPLNQRLALARSLAQSVLFLHSISFVHKNIRPDIVAVFRNSESNLGTPFLVGFERFRPEDGQTYMVGTGDFARNLYHHPSRQGILPEETYKMQHDIYSLGVLLLEIGLWTSLITSKNKRAQQPSRPQLLSPSEEPHATRRALRNKETLERLAADELPILMGQKYSYVVLACLTCLDEEEDLGFGVMGNDSLPFLDQDGLVIGSRFIEYVLDKFQEISV